MNMQSNSFAQLRNLLLVILGMISIGSHAADDSLRLEIQVIPALQNYANILSHPGYLAIALENIGLSPSVSSKLVVKERGQVVEIRNAVMRYTGRKGTTYSYDAGVTVNLGIADTKLTFPVAIDLSTVASGKIVVTLTPPLANLLPGELIEKIRIKTQLIANIEAQQKMLDYMGGLAKSAPKEGDAALFELILLDAYNKSGGPTTAQVRDIGDAVAVQDQWMLFLTLMIWLIVVPCTLLLRHFRRTRAKLV